MPDRGSGRRIRDAALAIAKLMITIKILCRLFRHPGALFLIGLLLLWLLWLFRQVIGFFLWMSVLMLTLLGLLALCFVGAALVQRWCRKASADPKGQGSVGHRGGRRVRIGSHTYKRPDPLIYSQTWLMAHGLAVTWDNPDIELWRQGQSVSSHDLLPSTAYQIRARIWNGSTEAPAIHALVRFHYLSFGIGTLKHLIGETFVDLPVKGASGLPAIAEHDWTTPAKAGHYCIQAEIVWPDDANPGNNLGQENVDVKKLNSPRATYELAIRNDARTRRTLTLQADGYAIPALPACPPDGATLGVTASPMGSIVGAREAWGRHARAAFPVPPGVSVEVVPSGGLDLEAGEETRVTVRIEVPSGHRGRGLINLNGFAGGQLVGGVTLYYHD